MSEMKAAQKGGQAGIPEGQAPFTTISSAAPTEETSARVGWGDDAASSAAPQPPSSGAAGGTAGGGAHSGGAEAAAAGTAAGRRSGVERNRSVAANDLAMEGFDEDEDEDGGRFGANMLNGRGGGAGGGSVVRGGAMGGGASLQRGESSNIHIHFNAAPISGGGGPPAEAVAVPIGIA